MIRFNAKFQVFDSPKVGVPKVKRHNENFWCSFNTKKQLIMCSIIYLGEDTNMQQYRWYDGIVELPYGEKFPPYCVELDFELSEPIILNEQYDLNAGGEIVGRCKLIDIIEIVRDDFNISKDEQGNY